MLAHETIREFAEDIIGNHGFENMEAILYTDGEHTIRQNGSFGKHEDEIVVKIPLGLSYWSESYIWGEDLDEDTKLVETAIDELIEEIYLRIADWQVMQADIKKLEEYFEEERKAYEDMIGL